MNARDLLHKIALFTTELRPEPGIYLLIHDDRVVYVGQSANVCARLSGHRTRCYDTIRMLPVYRDAERLKLERELIVALQPEDNRLMRSLREPEVFAGSDESPTPLEKEPST